MRNHLGRSALLAAVSVLALGYGPASAAIVFSESFSGTGALNGTSPDVSTTGAVWDAGSAFFKSGQVDSVVGSATGQAAHLFVNLQAGTYTASALVRNPNADWIGFGFMAKDVTAGDSTWQQTASYMRHSNQGQNTGNNGQGAYAWALVRNNTAANAADVQLFNGENTNGNFFNIEPLPTPTVKLDVVLNTSGTTWTAAYFVNGVQQGATQNLPASAITELGGIGFSRTSNATSTGGGSVDDLTLDFVPVPEPTSLAAVALAGVALRRRRRA